MSEDAISRDAAIDACNQSINMFEATDRIKDLPSVTPKQRTGESEVNTALDKIRTELHATAEMYEDGDYYLRDEWIDEIFDKYEAESEDNG